MQENTDSYSQQSVNENIQPQTQPQVIIQQKGSGSKCLISCGIGCLVLIILSVLVTGIGGYFAYKYVMDKVNTWSQEFEDMGFPRGEHFGVIAQEVDEVLPQVVSESPTGEKAVAYTEIIPVLIEAIKAQQEQIEALKARLADLEE